MQERSIPELRKLRFAASPAVSGEKGTKAGIARGKTSRHGTGEAVNRRSLGGEWSKRDENRHDSCKNVPFRIRGS